MLVFIEMFNAFNALSDEGSLLHVSPFTNAYLLGAVFISISLHCMICYVSIFERVFNTVPLSVNDWILVICCSFPVIIVDEI